MPQSRGWSEGVGSVQSPSKCEALKLQSFRSFEGPLAVIVRFTNLIYLAFYGHHKEKANLPTSPLFQGRATDGL